jgi:hypothetical protein
MEVQPDFRDLFVLLNEHKVEYLIVGGYALAGVAKRNRFRSAAVFPLLSHNKQNLLCSHLSLLINPFEGKQTDQTSSFIDGALQEGSRDRPSPLSELQVLGSKAFQKQKSVYNSASINELPIEILAFNNHKF